MVRRCSSPLLNWHLTRSYPLEKRRTRRISKTSKERSLGLSFALFLAGTKKSSSLREHSFLRVERENLEVENSQQSWPLTRTRTRSLEARTVEVLSITSLVRNQSISSDLYMSLGVIRQGNIMLNTLLSIGNFTATNRMAAAFHWAEPLVRKSPKQKTAPRFSRSIIICWDFRTQSYIKIFFRFLGLHQDILPISPLVLVNRTEESVTKTSSTILVVFVLQGMINGRQPRS
jgi:hypothetical protein